MTDGYGSHKDYMALLDEEARARETVVERALRDAFAGFIETHSVDVILFSSISAFVLADALVKQPAILKPIIAACNIAARAIERDLGIRNVDTYNPRVTRDQAIAIAGYIKPFLRHTWNCPRSFKLTGFIFSIRKLGKERDAGKNSSLCA